MTHGPREFKFKDGPDYNGLVASLQWGTINAELNQDFLSKTNIEYWIYNSVYCAELALVERLELSNLEMKNSIDYPLAAGEIGDNCWYQDKNGILLFIRNNVFIIISPSEWGDHFNWAEIEYVARKIDTAIENSKTVQRTKLPSPQIHSVDILTSRPTAWGETVKVKVNASDPNSQQTYSRKVGDGLGIVRTNGVFTLRLNKYVQAHVAQDPNKFRILIWVWNENNFVSLVEEEFSF
jgi:hypothetical protein